MQRLLFDNPMGLIGRFSTVRDGVYWMERIEIGEEVELATAKNDILGYARVVDFWVGDLAVVPASLLEIAHDPLHRTYSGLVMGLRCSYPDEKIKPDAKVTIIVLDFEKRSKLIKLS